MTAEQAFMEMVRVLMNTVGASVTNGASVCIGTVKDVNEKEATCTVERDGSPELYEVRLNAVIDEKITDSFTVFPAVGSYVMVLLIGGVTEGLVVATSKIDKVMIKTGGVSVDVSTSGIVMNGGKLGGLIDIAKLTEKINGFIDIYNSHTHTVSTTGSASAQSGSTISLSSAATRLSKGDYEDEKVKH